MARMAVGVIGGVPAVKVTRSNADDPKTTPDTEFAKFAFNSQHEQAIIAGVGTYNWNSYALGAEGTTQYYYLDGTSAANSIWRVRVTHANLGVDTVKVLECLAANLGIDYFFVYEGRLRSTAGWFNGPKLTWTERSAGEWGYYEATTGAGGGSRAAAGEGGYSGILGEVLSGGTTAPADPIIVATAWCLPSTDAALPGDATPTPGQKVVEISQSGIRIARRGYDVRTAAKKHLILDSDVVPAKVIMSGVTTVAAGATVHVANTSPFPITENMYLDPLVQRVGDPLRHPAVTFTGDFSARHFNLRWRMDSANNRISFENTGFYSISVRWFVCASDPNPPTTGGARVVQRGSSGGQEFFQIKRPGSSDTAPGLNDILLDTRLFYLRIVAEGWIPTAQFTEATDDIQLGEIRKTINFTNTGFTPFVKFMLQDYWPFDGSYTMRHPSQRNFRINSQGIGGNVADPEGWHGKPDRLSSMCVLGDNYARFYVNPNSAVTLDVTQGGTGPYAHADNGTNPRQIIGLRYYIFALPT